MTYRILKGNANNEGTNIAIKGFAVGNGFLDHKLNADSTIWYAYHHGLIGEDIWNTLQSKCCKSPYTRQTCDFYIPYEVNPDCVEEIGRTMAVVEGRYFNHYDIYGDCYADNEDVEFGEIVKYSHDKLMHELRYKYGKYPYIWDIIKNAQESNVPCVDTHGADIYLNNMTVRDAIHVKQNMSYEWSICSSTLDYKTLSVYYNMSDIFKGIFEMDNNIWSTVYNGDTDMSCDFLGDQWFVDDLGYELVKEYREWYIEDDNGEQVGGWTKNFDRLAFVTVRGSGHMVPQYRPQAAYKMFEYFLGNKQL